MNIQNFEKHIERKILARGKDYYFSQYIASLEYDGEEWVAEVEGSDDYTVTVSLSNNGDIIDTYCDCPYDMGNYCKHQVAVFFALQEKGLQRIASEKSKKTSNSERLDDVLAKLDKQTLISMIIEYAKTYKQIKSDIQLRYGKKPDIAKHARDVIRGSIKSVMHRGYVEYRDVNAATDGADTVIQMIEDKINSGEYLTAIALGIIVVEEMMELLNCCDDSNGHVGGAISAAISEIQSAISSMPENHKDNKKIFDTIIDHAFDSMYNGWTDWRSELLSALVPLCYCNESRLQLESHLITSDNLKASGWSRNYDLRQKQSLQLEIISRFDGDEAAQRYIESNMDNNDFRRTVIKSAIENGQYEKAIKLCIEGENANSEYAGIVKDFRQLQYAAYEAANNQPEQRILALTLLLDGDFDYFLKYKSLHSSVEWITAFYDMLEKIEELNPWGVYVKILVHEKHKPRLLDYCNKTSGAIVNHYTHLLPEYKHEVGQLFVDHIRRLATGADNRSRYHEVCNLIKTCDKVCPGVTSEVCDEIISKHAKRPAFMDEMRQIGKL